MWERGRWHWWCKFLSTKRSQLPVTPQLGTPKLRNKIQFYFNLFIWKEKKKVIDKLVYQVSIQSMQNNAQVLIHLFTPKEM